MWEQIKRSITAAFRLRIHRDAALPPSIGGNFARAAAGQSGQGPQQDRAIGYGTGQIINGLRNCLQVISGQGELLSLSLHQDEEVNWRVGEIQKAVDYATELISRLQELGGTVRNQQANPDPPKGSTGQPQTDSSNPSEMRRRCESPGGRARQVFWRSLPTLKGAVDVDLHADPGDAGCMTGPLEAG